MSSAVHPSRRLLGGLAAVALAASLLTVGGAANAATSTTDAVPDRIVLTPTQTPSTSQSFTWRTGADVLDGSVSIRVAGSGGDWRVVDSDPNAPLDGSIPTVSHSVTVDALEPATRYEYFVGNDDEVSETWEFTTAGAAGDPFTFLYFGDAQNQLGTTWGPVVEQAYERYPDAIGTVNAGDLINNSNNTEWDEWFGGMDGYSQTSNVIAAPGNHEYSQDSFMRQWKSNFEYPANGPAWDGIEGTTAAEQQEAAYREHMAEVIVETAYFTDYQDVRFIALNASRSQARALFTPDDLPACLIGCPDPIALWIDMQAQWLDEILRDNPNQWAVATFHQPVFSTAAGRDEADLRAAWLPVFQRNDIDLVLMGHDHTYARGYVNADATVEPGITTGPVYTVAVAGPKYYDMQPADDNVWTRNGATQVVRAGSTSTFQGITVDGNTLRYESVVAAKWDGDAASTTDVPVGGTLDSFTITKYDDGTKFVTEDGIAVPARGEGPAPLEPTTPPSDDEEPAGTPAVVPLGHEVIGHLDVAIDEPGPSAFDPAKGLLYVADQSAAGNGLVQEIRAATGEVVRSFEVGGPVADLAFVGAEGGMLVIGFSTEDGYFANGYSLSAEAFAETLLDDHIPMPAPIVSVALDAGSALAYFALSVGSIVVVDVDAGDMAGNVPIGTELRKIKVDQATGNLYMTLDSGDGSELRIYSGRGEFEPLRQYDLDAGASGLDLDTRLGLVYVGHDAAAGAGGMSVVDVIAETVARADAAEFGSDVAAVSVDTARGVVYATSSTKTPHAVVEVGRHQAPSIVTSPTPVTIDAGQTATFTASAWAVPTATVAWESRSAGAAEWAPVPDATELTLTVAGGVDGTQYRAVFSNTVAGDGYSTVSGTATLTVIGDDGPGDGEPGEGEPGDEAPTGTPDPINDADLTDGNRGGVTVTLDGRTAHLNTGASNAGGWIGVYVHSTPQFLGWLRADLTGTVSVTLPAALSGAHKLVALDSTGALIGWAPMALPTVQELQATGAELGPVPFAVAGLLVLLGAGALVTAGLRRRAQQ